MKHDKLNGIAFRMTTQRPGETSQNLMYKRTSNVSLEGIPLKMDDTSRTIDYHIHTTNRSCITDARRYTFLLKKIVSKLPSCIGTDGGSISNCSLEKQIQTPQCISTYLVNPKQQKEAYCACIIRTKIKSQQTGIIISFGRKHYSNNTWYTQCPPNSRKAKQKPKKGFPYRSGNNDTPSNAHLGKKNERLMRQRNIKRVLGAVPRRALTESVNPHLEQLAMIRSSRKFVNCLPLGTARNAELFRGSILREIYDKEFFLLYPFIREVFEEAKH
ncbi:hypothetical protein CDAR_291581 [Caerostris darwini]|uniref:Uncharacterized protein n=1 Tax=Caerostris darwini TaxID=1538125 RepID=A0AAV4VDP8_9ARAC|nr:hypothetical protein CDAR_291581 [Caerostris darwini]